MVGGVPLGGGSRISVQSMLNVPADQVEKSVEQALALEKAGCDIVRIAVPNMEAVRLVYALKSVLSIPVVADIHFDYRLALEAAAAGVDKIRINPGNIGDEGKVKAVADTCRQKGNPHSDRSKLGLSGKRDFGEIRPSHAGSPAGQRFVPRLPIGKI